MKKLITVLLFIISSITFNFSIKIIETPSQAKVVFEQLYQHKKICLEMICNTTRLSSDLISRNCVHLLEHLVARGKDDQLIFELETVGLTFRAETHHDHLRISIEGKPESLNVALTVFKEIIKGNIYSKEQIRQEIAVLKHELASRSDTEIQLEKLRETIYGTFFTESFGQIKNFERVTPDQLLNLQKELYSFNNIIISITGPLQEQTLLNEIKTRIPALWGVYSKKLSHHSKVSPIINKTVLNDPSIFLISGIFEKETLITKLALYSLLKTDRLFKIYDDFSIYPGYIKVIKFNNSQFIVNSDSFTKGKENLMAYFDIKKAAYLNGILAMDACLKTYPHLIQAVKAIKQEEFDEKLKKVLAQLEKVAVTEELAFQKSSALFETIELKAPSIVNTSYDTQHQLLAIYALTAGCGSSFYRIARQKNAWCYELESICKPKETGWDLYLYLKIPKKDLSYHFITHLKSEFNKDIDHWNQSHIIRTLKLIEASLFYDLSVYPLSHFSQDSLYNFLYQKNNCYQLKKVKKAAYDLVQNLL